MAVDTFAKIGDIKGESQDDKHKEEIELLSWSWGVNQTGTVASGTAVAWLFVTPFQRPWYDVMAIGLLALYPASWLDWVVLIRLLAGASVYVHAVQSPAEPHWLYDLSQFNGTWITPGVRLLAAVALVWFCVSGRWGWRSRSAAVSGRRPELLPTT